MTPKPIAIGLLLCDRVIVDKDTNSPSAIGIFTGLAVEQFPSDPQRFSVLCVLTDAQGDGRAKLGVYHLNEHWLRQEEIYGTEHMIRFPDRFAVVNFNLRVRTIRFPAPASYEFVLFVDGDEVAHRRVRATKRCRELLFDGVEPWKAGRTLITTSRLAILLRGCTSKRAMRRNNPAALSASRVARRHPRRQRSLV
jgi:hypothetical protein